MYCKNCGKQIDDKAEICVYCGVRQKEQTQVKSPTTAAILSFLLAGLGQIYNGETSKGFLFMFVTLILLLTVFIGIGIILYPLFYIYQIYDAYRVANEVAK